MNPEPDDILAGNDNGCIDELSLRRIRVLVGCNEEQAVRIANFASSLNSLEGRDIGPREAAKALDYLDFIGSQAKAYKKANPQQWFLDYNCFPTRLSLPAEKALYKVAYPSPP